MLYEVMFNIGFLLFPSIVQAVTDESNTLAVRCPRVHIDSPLPAEQFDQSLWFSLSGAIHKAQFHVLVSEVLVRLQIPFLITQVNHELPIGGNMREPSVPGLVESHLRLFAAIRLHPPDLHQP